MDHSVTKKRAQSNEIDMLNGPLFKKILLFALPLAASSLLQELFNSVDVAVVGHFVGSRALAAVGSNAPVIGLLINLFMGVSMGACAIISNHIGQQDDRSIRNAISTVQLVALLSGFFLLVLGQVAARPILTWMGTPPDVLDEAGETLSGAFAAAALAGVIASNADPAVPLNGAEIRVLGGVSTDYGDNDIDLLVRGGVTPLESSGGVLSPVRGITTRTTTGDVTDTTWRELTTIRIVDDVIPAVRNALRAKFRRAKNTEQSRGAIRYQVVLELENRKEREIISGYDNVAVSADPDNPTVCQVEFSFSAAQGLNQIWLTAHITV